MSNPAPADQSISDTCLTRMNERFQKLLIVHRLQQALRKAQREVEALESSGDAAGSPR